MKLSLCLLSIVLNATALKISQATSTTTQTIKTGLSDLTSSYSVLTDNNLNKKYLIIAATLTIPLPNPNTADIQIFGQLTGKDVNASSFTCTTFYTNGALSNTYFVNSFYG